MGKGSLRSKQDRRDRLLGLLRSGDFWTTHELAKEISTSHRTLMRDIAELKEAGYPIESDRGRGGGVSLVGRWGIDRLSLTNQEAITLLLSLAVVESLSPTSYGLGARQLKQKIANTFPEPQRKVITSLRNRILIGEPASKDVLSSFKRIDEDVFAKIKVAFFNAKRVELRYVDEKGQKTNRQVDPQFLLLNWPIWYLLAWDYLRKDVRVFRIDRITSPVAQTTPMIKRSKALFLTAFEEYFSSL